MIGFRSNLPIPILSASPLSKQITTKLEKGLISNVSNGTLTKIGISNAPSSIVGNFATNFVQTQISNTGISSMVYQQGCL